VFILFGFRRRVATLVVVTLACRNGHVCAHRLLKATRWFTVFFIPVIPFSTKYISVCAQCGVQFEIQKAEAQAELANAGVPAPHRSDPVAPVLPSGASFYSVDDKSYGPLSPVEPSQGWGSN
jgi:hypothetical protein